MNMNRIAISSLLLAVASPAIGNPAWTADDIGQALTRFGSEKAGNEAGTIPEYTGGLQVAANLQPGDGLWPNPFAEEAPLFRITAENATKPK